MQPNRPIPRNIEHNHTYKVEPLPYSLQAQALEAWGQRLGWDIKAIRTLGARTWLVASTTEKPEGVLGYNGAPLLIKEVLSRKKQQGPVLAGARPSARPSYDGRVHQAGGPTPVDHWAQYIEKTGGTGIKKVEQVQPAADMPRKVEGPTEARFQQQDQRMHKLELEIQAMRQEHKDMGQTMEQAFQEASKREETFRADVRQEVSQLTASFQDQIQRHEAKYDDCIRDLKAFFVQMQQKPPAQGHKRPGPADGARLHDMEQDG